MSFKINSATEYQQQCQFAADNPTEFWNNIADNFSWEKKWDKTYECDLNNGKITWFKNAQLNITLNCLERHIDNGKQDNIALIWEPNDPNDKSLSFTYGKLYNKTLQFAALLKDHNVSKGDRVSIYMPMVPEALIAMLACARLGAVHSVVFAGFSANSLAGRINDCGSKFLITADILKRGAKEIRLIDIANEALNSCDSIEKAIIYKRNDAAVSSPKPYIIWQEEINKYQAECPAEIIDSEDPLFILYTSGSTGKPKGIVHSSAGYMVYSAYSFQNVFQYQEQDIYFCTADIGWITGHSYLVYAPLLCGATTVMFEGVPTYPDAGRFWDIIEKHKINIFYTAPTAIRALMQHGDSFVHRAKLDSLKTLGTVGEPINEEAWQWYCDKVGKRNCPIVDTWWQTETGAIMISSLSGITNSKPSFAGFPLPGIAPIILDNDAVEVTQDNVTGNLCFKNPWPSMLRTMWGDHQRAIDTYYSKFKGYYFSGDGCFKTQEGLHRITGRVDDVINVSGHRFGTAEIENAINTHHNITESAVIGIPHKIKGEGIYAFIIADRNIEIKQDEIITLITQQIGSIAKPEKIIFVSDLPKTRSGKIMRRILKKIAVNDNDLGDISTLINPDIITELKNLAN